MLRKRGGDPVHSIFLRSGVFTVVKSVVTLTPLTASVAHLCNCYSLSVHERVHGVTLPTKRKVPFLRAYLDFYQLKTRHALTGQYLKRIGSREDDSC